MSKPVTVGSGGGIVPFPGSRVLRKTDHSFIRLIKKQKKICHHYFYSIFDITGHQIIIDSNMISLPY